MNKVRPVLIVLLSLIALAITGIPLARATPPGHFYGEAFMQTCLWWGCITSSELGSGASIQMNQVAIGSSSSLADWVSLDNFDQNGHQWIQAGYAIGNLPDGTFTSTPVFYGEYQTTTSLENHIVGSYTFYNFGPASFGSWHRFQVWEGSANEPANEYIAIDGTVKETLPRTFYKGQVSASLETIEPGFAPSIALANGQWQSLQFYGASTGALATGSWRAWGDSDPAQAGVNPTSSLLAGTWTCTNGYIPQLVSVSEFKVSWWSFDSCGAGKGGIPLAPLATTRFLGPGDGSPQSNLPASFNDTTLGAIFILSSAFALLAIPVSAWAIHRHRHDKKPSNVRAS